METAPDSSLSLPHPKSESCTAKCQKAFGKYLHDHVYYVPTVVITIEDFKQHCPPFTVLPDF